MNTNGSIKSSAVRKRQSGATAAEFALLFPLLFAVLYGTITYGYAFFIQQEINFATEQGARAAVAFVDPNGTTTTGNRCAAATAAITTALQATMSVTELGFLGTPTCTPSTFANSGTLPIPATVTQLKLTLTFNFLGMLPAIVLPGIGNIPILPARLTASATVLE